jgi:spore maturation protein CgeB
MTFAQLLRQYGALLPVLHIEDYPDFPARGVMLDVSRDKVPTMKTLFDLVDLLARLKRAFGFLLFFHDSHYRVLTQPVRMARLGLGRFDAILAYGPAIADEYRRRLGLGQVHVFHEAADTALFRPQPADPRRPMDDALFIGNWGGRDRAHELREFLLRPARRFRAARRFAIYGVRYPPPIAQTIQRHYGVEYRGWLPNYLVPRAFAQTRVAVHVVRRQYTQVLHGTPTIRVFEALACGAALVSTPWRDTDGLFRAGQDYLVVDSRAQMMEALEWLWRDPAARERLGKSGAARVRAQHTCRHRARQLLALVARLNGGEPAADLQRVHRAPVTGTGVRLGTNGHAGVARSAFGGLGSSLRVTSSELGGGDSAAPSAEPATPRRRPRPRAAYAVPAPVPSRLGRM